LFTSFIDSTFSPQALVSRDWPKKWPIAGKRAVNLSMCATAGFGAFTGCSFEFRDMAYFVRGVRGQGKAPTKLERKIFGFRGNRLAIFVFFVVVQVPLPLIEFVVIVAELTLIAIAVNILKISHCISSSFS
jgi:hypothetical protein